MNLCDILAFVRSMLSLTHPIKTLEDPLPGYQTPIGTWTF